MHWIAYIGFRRSGPPTDAIVEYEVQFPRENSPLITEFLSQYQDANAILKEQKMPYHGQSHPNPQLVSKIQSALECGTHF